MAATRIFNGLRYNETSGYMTKSAAKSYAKNLKGKGYKVRTVSKQYKGRTMYVIYTR